MTASQQPQGRPAAPPPGWQPYAGQPQRRVGPGPGLLPLVAGIVLLLLGFLALSWARHGDTVKYTDLLGTYRHADAPHDVGPKVGFYYVIAGAAGLSLLGAIQATLWSAGVVRSQRSAGWVFGLWGRLAWRSDNPFARLRVLACWVQLLLLCLHGWGLWEVFDGKVDQAGPGAWMVLIGAFCLLLAAALGPRET